MTPLAPISPLADPARGDGGEHDFGEHEVVTTYNTGKKALKKSALYCKKCGMVKTIYCDKA